MAGEVHQNFQFVSPRQSCPGEEATYWLVLIHYLKGIIIIIGVGKQLMLSY